MDHLVFAVGAHHAARLADSTPGWLAAIAVIVALALIVGGMGAAAAAQARAAQDRRES